MANRKEQKPSLLKRLFSSESSAGSAPTTKSPTGPLTFESFSEEFLELVNSNDALVATREALLRSFACAKESNRQKAILWLDFTYVCYERMLAEAIGNNEIELAANIAMWHGIIRSILQKPDIDQAFHQAFELAKVIHDPVFTAQATEEYAWALNSPSRALAHKTQLAKAEEYFRDCGRDDRANEIVRLRNGGERFESSFLQRRKVHPEATSILGSFDAHELQLLLT